VVIILEANFINLSGKPSPDSKIAQATTPVLLLIFLIFTLMEGHSVCAKPFDGNQRKHKASKKNSFENLREIGRHIRKP
jgi:hypothetical protein